MNNYIGVYIHIYIYIFIMIHLKIACDKKVRNTYDFSNMTFSEAAVLDQKQVSPETDCSNNTYDVTTIYIHKCYIV